MFRRVWMFATTLLVSVWTDGAVAVDASGEAIMIDPHASLPSMGSNLFVHDDAVYMSWLERMDDPASQDDRTDGPEIWRVQWAKWSEEAGWSHPQTITQTTQFFINWADFPSIACLNDGTMIVHTLEKSGAPNPYAYDVVLYQSTDDGATWTRLGRPHQDLTATEHGFCTMAPNGNEANVFWLDGRAMVGGHGHESGGDMSLRTTIFRASGFDERAVLDDRTCECCNTDATITEGGPVVVYRDRDQNEMRDISIVRFVDGAWTQPALVHRDDWMMPGCPVNGPAIDADRSRVAVAWFTAAGGDEKVKVAFSDNSGTTFGRVVVIDEAKGRDAPLGRVDVVWDSQTGDAIVSWLDADSSTREPVAGKGDYAAGGAVIRACRVKVDGTVGQPVDVAVTSRARASGFPIMVLLDDTLIFSWTDIDRESGSTVRAAKLACKDVR